MLDTGCWRLRPGRGGVGDAGCWILDAGACAPAAVGSGMLDAGCWMLVGAVERVIVRRRLHRRSKISEA
ncbi:MAG: hypothetical protein D6681_17410, partial [Calditrichaeota bacterium]